MLDEAIRSITLQQCDTIKTHGRSTMNTLPKILKYTLHYTNDAAKSNYASTLTTSIAIIKLY